MLGLNAGLLQAASLLVLDKRHMGAALGVVSACMYKYAWSGASPCLLKGLSHARINAEPVWAAISARRGCWLSYASLALHSDSVASASLTDLDCMCRIAGQRLCVIP